MTAMGNTVAIGSESRTGLPRLDFSGSGAAHSFHGRRSCPDAGRWPQVQAHVHADRAVRAGILLDRGLTGLLRGLHPSMRWKAPVLSFHCGRIDRELRLAGRGLLLLPSFFCGEGA